MARGGNRQDEEQEESGTVHVVSPAFSDATNRSAERRFELQLEK